MTTQLELAPVLDELPSRGELEAREEVASTLRDALPLLWTMRDAGQVVDLRAPNDSGLPTDVMSIFPYYFLKGDPKQKGAWQIIQGERPPIYVSSSPVQAKGGGAEAVIGAKINRQGTASGKVDLGRAKEVVGILKIGATEFARQRAQRTVTAEKHGDSNPHKKRFTGVGRLLGFSR